MFFSKRLLYVSGLILCMNGCALNTSAMSSIRSLTLHGDFLQAQRIAESTWSEDAERNFGLWYRSRAILAYLSHDYPASSAFFEQAKTHYTLYRPTSISEQGSSFITNDTSTAYIGALYENILLYVFAALNYINEGNFAAARVEILQLQTFIQGTPGTIDPILLAGAHAFRGLLFNAIGELDNTAIAYRKAVIAYGKLAVPKVLQVDFLHALHNIGLIQEYNTYLALWRLATPLPHPNITMVVLQGLVSKKTPETLVYYGNSNGVYFPYQIPSYSTYPPPVQVALTADSSVIFSTTIFDVDALARTELNNNNAVIIAKTIARLLVKSALQTAIQQENQNLGILSSLFFGITEDADLRSWSLLPQSIQVFRIQLTTGDHLVQIKSTSGTQHQSTINVSSDQPIFLTHWLL